MNMQSTHSSKLEITGVPRQIAPHILLPYQLPSRTDAEADARVLVPFPATQSSFDV